MIKRFVLTALLLTAAIGPARAQSEQECVPARVWAIGTDLADWAELVGIEALIIDQNTTIPGIKRDIKLGELFYQ